MKACGRGEAGVAIERADQRLERVGEDRGVGEAAAVELAAAELEEAAEAELAADLGERLAAHQAGVALGERALALAREAGHQQVGDHEVEHAIAEELEALVAAPRAPRGADRAAVGQRLAEQRGIGEAMADPGARARPR